MKNMRLNCIRSSEANISVRKDQQTTIRLQSINALVPNFRDESKISQNYHDSETYITFR